MYLTPITFVPARSNRTSASLLPSVTFVCTLPFTDTSYSVAPIASVQLTFPPAYLSLSLIALLRTVISVHDDTLLPLIARTAITWSLSCVRLYALKSNSFLSALTPFASFTRTSYVAPDTAFHVRISPTIFSSVGFATLVFSYFTLVASGEIYPSVSGYTLTSISPASYSARL